MPFSKNSVWIHVIAQSQMPLTNLQSTVHYTARRRRAIASLLLAAGRAAYNLRGDTGCAGTLAARGHWLRGDTGSGPRTRMVTPVQLGFVTAAPVHVNLAAPRLIEHAVQRREAILTERGAVVANTAPHTGRAARDKYVVVEPASEAQVWWGSVNQRLPAEPFQRIQRRVQEHLGQR